MPSGARKRCDMIDMPRHGVQPSKRQIQALLKDGDSIDRIAQCSVAVYILMTVAMDYADDIKDIAARHGLFVGFMKHEYTALDKAMRRYETAFRDTVARDYENEFFGGYDKGSEMIEGYIEDNKDVFMRLVADIRELSDRYVTRNVVNDNEEIEKVIDKLK